MQRERKKRSSPCVSAKALPTASVEMHGEVSFCPQSGFSNSIEGQGVKNMSTDSNSQAIVTPLKAPSTETPDGSTLMLKTEGQIYITLGWVFAVISFAIGIAIGVGMDNVAAGIVSFVPFLVGAILFVYWGYSKGAKAKATAKAAIDAAKAAERTARMEQMMVNMVNGVGPVAQPQQQVKCSKCGASIPSSSKFCPECGTSTKTKCAKCGTEIAPNAKFCPECGAKVSAIGENDISPSAKSHEADMDANRVVAVVTPDSKEVAKHSAKNNTAESPDDSIIPMVPIPGKGFSISKYPVTQEIWEMILGDNPSKFKGADRPVESVSWMDCHLFLEKLNARPEVVASGHPYRLPTEEEWQYSCRAGSKGDFCKLEDGTEITKSNLGDVAWFDKNSDGQTHPVGQKKPNAFGLYDMLGNVWEWTSTQRAGGRVNCGGSFGADKYSFACGVSDTNNPTIRDKALGFRLVRELSQQS